MGTEDNTKMHRHSLPQGATSLVFAATAACLLGKTAKCVVTPYLQQPEANTQKVDHLPLPRRPERQAPVTHTLTLSHLHTHTHTFSEARKSHMLNDLIALQGSKNSPTVEAAAERRNRRSTLLL